MIGLSEKEIDTIIRKVYEGGYTSRKLPKKLFEATKSKLNEGIDIGSPGADEALINDLKDNIYMFSAAKTYTQIKDISSLNVENGELIPYTEFKLLAKDRFNLYNKEYLKAEYDTAIGQTQTAVKWKQITEDTETFPYLQRKAVMDANTSPECVLLNDIIAPVGDPFWRTRSPLTHFRCRCIISQIDKYAAVKLSSRVKINKVIKETESINDIFKGNPGIDKVVFNSQHPYFDVEKKDKAFAKRNFGL